MLVMNSLAFFRLPLKVGHVPKRLVGVSADAIVGGSGIGLSGGIGDPGSGSLGSFSGSGSFDSSSGSGSVRLRIRRQKGQLLSLAVWVVLDLIL